MEKNILNEINKIKFFMSYSPGKLISEQKNIKLITEQQEKKYTDWTEVGSKSWETANIKKIIQYIKEIDADQGYSRSPIYLSMLTWFQENDSPETRESLKAWLGNDLTFGINNDKAPDVLNNMTKGLKGRDLIRSKSGEQTKVATKKDTEEKPKQAEALNLLNKVKGQLNNTSYEDLKKKINTFLTELTAFNSKNVFMPVDTSQTIINYMNFIIGALGENNQYSVSYVAVVELSKDDLNPYREGVISQLTVAANEQLKDKDFLDGFFRGVKPNITDMILKAKDIQIKQQDVTVLSQYKEEKKKEQETGKSLAVTKYSWPLENANETERNEASRNFFDDDGTEIDPETIAQLTNQVNLAVNEYNRIMKESNNNAKAKGLYLNFYSSTSKVRTSYGNNDRTFSEANNVQLSKDRIEAMKNKLYELIGETILDDFEKTVVLELSDPNRGPGWSNIKSSYLDGSDMDFATAYKNAPLFVEAHKKYSKLTPKQFYGRRDSNAVAYAKKLLGKDVSIDDLMTEYENTYSAFRHATCGFNMAIEVPKGLNDDKEIDFIVSVSGGLGAMITWVNWEWDVKWPKIKKGSGRKFLVRLKRAILPNKSFKPVRKINCPVW
jgi:outer membrane protein OmpA-like peptidoglycan-associated protein